MHISLILWLKNEEGTVLPILAAVLLPFVAMLILLFDLWVSDIERTRLQSKLYSCAMPSIHEYRKFLLYHEGIQRSDGFIILSLGASIIENQRKIADNISLCIEEGLQLSYRPNIIVSQKNIYVTNNKIVSRLWLDIAMTDQGAEGHVFTSQQIPLKIAVVNKANGFSDYMLYKSEGYEVLHDKYISASQGN